MVEFMDLPLEILALICSMLDTSSKLKMCKTCAFFDNMMSSKSLVRHMRLNTVIDFDKQDIEFIVNNRIRCNNITTLNVDGWYWIPRKELYLAIRKLTNLKELFALDTKLQVQDIYLLLGVLKNLEFVSFTYLDGKIQREALQKYKERFRQLSTLMIEYRGSKELDQLSSFLSGFKNYCVTPTLRKVNYKLINRDYLYIKLRNSSFLKDLYNGALPGYYELLCAFLPDLEPVEWTRRTTYRLAFAYDTLLQMRDKKITVRDIYKICLFDIKYNFKDKQLPDTFKTITDLFLNDEQIFDVPNAPRPPSKSRSKKQRLGVQESADDEEKQPIRTLAAACPNLRVLCIKKRENSETSMTWYSNCLRSISLWKHLKVLTLHNIESRNGAFLQDVAKNCPDLTHLTLCLTGPPGSVCIFATDICEALPYMTRIQYFHVQEIEPRVQDLLHALAHCSTLRVVMMQINHKLCVRKVSNVNYDNLKFLLVNVPELIFLHIIDPEFTKHCAYNLETAIKKEFKSRKWLKVYMDDCKCEVTAERLKPLFLNDYDLTNWTYWMK